ncbi:hypothetical protein [Shewanella sp.]|uniref:hypothetical protein n=1 Tax=Shewanella sp. TaxID=50422 RepID=UPI00404729F1
MPNSETDDLFIQVRSASRLLAAYYQRLLPTLAQIAKGLNVDFYTWSPKEFTRPAQLTTSPFERWGWDMLPALSTYYVFKHVEDNNKVRVGEYLVEFLVNSDSAVMSNSNNGSEPNALSLSTSVDEAKSTLKISIYAPYKDSEKNWHYGMWNTCPNFPATQDPNPMQNVDSEAYYSSFEVPLADVMEDGAVDVLVSRAQEFIDVTVARAKYFSTEPA